MKNKFFVYSYILLFIAFTNLPFFKLHSSNLNDSTKISVDFLKKLPPNDYIIGPGDSLKIFISRDLNLFAQVSVDGEGTINLPKLERVYVSGLTINELNSLLNEAYLEFVKFPEVETIVIGYRPIRVFVDGEVVSPGIQKMSGSLTIPTTDVAAEFLNSTVDQSTSNTNYFFPTVFDAIRESGGVTQYSNLRNVQIIRKNSISNGAGKITTTLNFEDYLKVGENNQNIRIYDSDIIRIKRNNEPNTNLLTKAILSNLNPKFIKVFVSGRVNRPGNISLSRASVLSDAIDMAGGAKVLRGPVTFIRFKSNGSIDKRKIRLTKNKRGGFSNPNLRDGDLIIVGESLISLTNQVINEFTSPFLGIYSTYGLIKVISD